ncbi:SDR family NAD(P)-dependent oxidoreductase, partial [Klebsiella pneumoniae]|uniref:SDR family NAD(P)-dependent oxidoreductase n=1 Tax=Klebsiella pneumoniae TaxID=573 RepID=UPI00272EEF3D
GVGADATIDAIFTSLAPGVDELFERVDLLVSSAGIAKAAFSSDFALGDFDRSLQGTLVGDVLCAREVSRWMIRDGVKG